MASNHLKAAAALDASGRIEEAWKELERGAHAGEAACARMMGLRLIVGDRVPPQLERGLALLGQACDAGLIEAASRAAALLALGTSHAPPDVPAALQWMARAATAGSQSARGQLRALSEDRALAASANPDWQALSRTVDAGAWTTAPPAHLHSQSPRVGMVAGFMRSEICAQWATLARPRLAPARVYDNSSRADIVVHERSNTSASFGLATVELIHVLVQRRIAAACGVSERQLEPPTVLHYTPGQEFRDHFDFFNPDAPGASASIATQGQRVMTCLVYLNEDYDGGETAFPVLGLSLRGRTGDALFFDNVLADGSPDRRTRHGGRPTTRGEKWILSQFIRGKHLR
jgi:hypothetical protein